MTPGDAAPDTNLRCGEGPSAPFSTPAMRRALSACVQPAAHSRHVPKHMIHLAWGNALPGPFYPGDCVHVLAQCCVHLRCFVWGNAQIGLREEVKMVPADPNVRGVRLTKLSQQVQNILRIHTCCASALPLTVPPVLLHANTLHANKTREAPGL